MTSLAFVDAIRLVELLRRGDIAAVEVMRECLGRIEEFNPRLNAIVSLRPERELLLEAAAADRRRRAGEPIGALHGVPMAIKDLSLTRGLRTTFGSRIYSDFVPASDELYVERCKQAGAILIGKTNTPEFGAGSQTFNAVFGATRNPYDLAKTCGGSSGGAAAALAGGLLWLADGTDLGGSLRNPASFCNVVGFRPSPGRVPRLNARAGDKLGVHGPMARTVADVAWLLGVMAGPDARDAASLPEPGASFSTVSHRAFGGVRVAFSECLGRYPVEPTVAAVCGVARTVLAGLGCDVADAEPDFADVDDLFQTLRAAGFAASHARDLEQHRALLKDTVVWNIERGLALTSDDLARAARLQQQLDERLAQFFARYEFLVLPTVQVAPFAVETQWVKAINGIPMQTYIDWMATCYAISCTGSPAISVPCGFTDDGLPIGLQIVGRRASDRAVLELALAFEQATQVGRIRPPSLVG